MIPERLMNVLLSPVVSEKAATAAERNQYVFRVLPDATKQEVRSAVERLFEVEVQAVQILNVKGKRKRFGRYAGQRQDWRKAYVRLKPGHTLDLGGPA